MLIMVEAPQECLSPFSKIETLGIEQREALEGLISPSMWRDTNLNAQSLSTDEEHFSSKTAVLL